MKKNYLIVLLALLSVLFISCNSKPKENATSEDSAKPIIIAYVGGFHGKLDVSKISADKITHINYAFVNVEDGKAVLTNEVTDSTNFRMLNQLKKQNPDLKILISLGGWTWSGKFSDAVLTPESRDIFAQSSVDIMDKYKLDGVDIDWEYPAMPGDEGNIYRPEDKDNYTLMFAAIREKLDKLTEKTSKKYLLTTATGGFQKFIDNTNMAEAQKYLDFVNIMTYDTQSKDQAVHHTNTYPSKAYENHHSASIAVDQYIKAGVPVEKLVMGIAFYGRFFELADGANKGVGDKLNKQIEGKGFSFIKDSLENKRGFTKYWDEDAKAPYLFNKEKKIFGTYDDEQSTKEKCQFVLDKGMGGVMFWEYGSDPKEYLLDAINEVIK